MLRTRVDVIALVLVPLIVGGCSATRPASPMKCATVGSLLGGVGGAAAGAATGDDWPQVDSGGAGAVLGAVGGAAVGAAIGYGICALMPAEQVAQAAPPQPPPAPVVKKKIVLPGVSFGLDKATLSSDAAAVIDREVVPVMKQEAGLTVKVEGFTDSSGPEDYNQQLSERRAQGVREHLEAAGIDGSRIEVVGMGESQPVATNDTAAGRAENRRVEIKVLRY